MATTRKIDENQLLTDLITRVAEVLKETEIHPRDLASVGNLVMKIMERKDKLDALAAAKEGNAEKVVAMPAMPPIRVATEFDKAMARTEAKTKAKRA